MHSRVSYAGDKLGYQEQGSHDVHASQFLSIRGVLYDYLDDSCELHHVTNQLSKSDMGTVTINTPDPRIKPVGLQQLVGRRCPAVPFRRVSYLTPQENRQVLTCLVREGWSDRSSDVPQY